MLNAEEGEERGEEKDTMPAVLAKVRLGLFKGIRYFDLLQQLLMHRIEITFIPLNNAVICMYNVCLSSLEKIFLRKFKIVLFYTVFSAEKHAQQVGVSTSLFISP